MLHIFLLMSLHLSKGTLASINHSDHIILFAEIIWIMGLREFTALPLRLTESLLLSNALQNKSSKCPELPRSSVQNGALMCFVLRIVIAQWLRQMPRGLWQMDPHPVVWCKALHSLDMLSRHPSLELLLHGMMRTWSVGEAKCAFVVGLFCNTEATSPSLAIYSGFLTAFNNIQSWIPLQSCEPFPLDLEPTWNTSRMPTWTSKQSHAYIYFRGMLTKTPGH